MEDRQVGDLRNCQTAERHDGDIQYGGPRSKNGFNHPESTADGVPRTKSKTLRPTSVHRPAGTVITIKLGRATVMESSHAFWKSCPICRTISRKRRDKTICGCDPDTAERDPIPA